MKTAFRISAALLLLGAPVFAGPPMDFKKSVVEPEEEVVVPLNEFSLVGSYVFDSDFEGDFQDEGSQSAWHGRIYYGHRFPLSDRLFFKLGAKYSRISFSSTGAPVPNTLHAAAAVLSLEYKVEGTTGFLLESSPGLYFSDNANGEAFDAPTNIGFAYPIFGGRNFFLVVGAGFSLLREYTVLPVIGIAWRINEEWDLKLYGTEPRLIYRPNDDVELFVGGELAGGSYYIEKSDQDDDEDDFDQEMDYVEYRGLIGANYSGLDPFIFEVAAGYVFGRQFHFHEQKERIELEGSPFVSASIRAEF
jgi:hypothetical protein